MNIIKMPSKESKKALDMGLITKKQYSNLPPKLLEAVAKKKLADNKPPVKKSSKKKNK
jgi:hypothetical protein